MSTEQFWQLVREAYAKRGYIVLASNHPDAIGHILTETDAAIGCQPLEQPFRVLARSTREEYVEQMRSLNRPFNNAKADYFYKLVTE